MKNPAIPRIAFALMLFAAAPVLAGPGHDHGDEKPVAAGNVAPRFAAHSELFELVGVAGAKELTLYLDRYADNAPLTTGAIELEIKPAQGEALRVKAAATPGGGFVAALAKPLAAGTHAVTATVSTTLDGRAETDLLAATLDIPQEAHAETRPHQHFSAYAILGAAVAAILGMVVWLKLRRRRGVSNLGVLK